MTFHVFCRVSYVFSNYGVRQDRILSPFLFLIVTDFLMRKTVEGRSFGINWGQDKLADLDFTDDLMHFA